MNVSQSLLAAAATGILFGVPGCASTKAATGEPAAASPTAMPEGAKHACRGQNDCKGQGGCKSNKHDCKGQNDCKGQGGCKG